jgi:hypothetical protein
MLETQPDDGATLVALDHGNGYGANTEETADATVVLGAATLDT